VVERYYFLYNSQSYARTLIAFFGMQPLKNIKYLLPIVIVKADAIVPIGDLVIRNIGIRNSFLR
jgi:hypothetical protein